MKHFIQKTIVLILGILLLSCVFAFAVVYAYYATAFGLFLVLMVQVVLLLQLQSATVGDMQQALDLVRTGSFKDKVTLPRHSLVRAWVDELGDLLQNYKVKLHDEAVRQHYYESLLDEVDMAVVVCRNGGEIIWQNKSAIALLGTLRELPADWVSPHRAQKVQYTHHGTAYEMVVSSTRFMLSDSSLHIVTLKDIHEVLEETEMEAWQKLVRVLTHEIMNSLAPIIALSEQGAMSESEHMDVGAAQTALSVIHRRSKRLLEFVQNYRKLTRLPQPQPEWVAFQEYCDDLQQFYADRLTFDIQPSDLEVWADPGLLMQVLDNLVKNAMEAGSGEVVLSACRSVQGGTEISVLDHGCGIVPEVLERIFIPFFTTKEKGSGIGLSLSKQIVVKHGGTLKVKSQLGVGSRFTLRLP